MKSSDKTRMDLVDDEKTICDRCGTEYDWQNQDPPEDATYYWVPSCPDCHSKMTANPTSASWLRIVSEGISSDEENYEDRIDKVNAYARLYHGKMCGMSTEDLVKRAKWFDRQAKSGTAYGPRFYRPIAFSLRRQAREEM